MAARTAGAPVLALPDGVLQLVVALCGPDGPALPLACGGWRRAVEGHWELRCRAAPWFHPALDPPAPSWRALHRRVARGLPRFGVAYAPRRGGAPAAGEWLSFADCAGADWAGHACPCEFRGTHFAVRGPDGRRLVGEARAGALLVARDPPPPLTPDGGGDGDGRFCAAELLCEQWAPAASQRSSGIEELLAKCEDLDALSAEFFLRPRRRRAPCCVQ